MESDLANLTGTERSHYVQNIFSQIAPRYDLMNRLMTAGQDVRWRKEVIRHAKLPNFGSLLDLGAGTGDLAREALRQHKDCRAVAADFTIEMMLAGRARPNIIQCLDWAASDAHLLPFSENEFDAIVSGFLLRNVSNLKQSLGEQYRVLKPGGKIVSLDTSPPKKNIFAPLLRFHLHTIIPALGRLLTGHRDAYTYLPDSTEYFLEPEKLAERLTETGFQHVGFVRRMFGTIAIHWGKKPDPEKG